MKSSPTSRRPRFRSTLRTWASLIVLGFIAAQVLCFVHCHFSRLLASSSEAAGPSCHAVAKHSCCEKNKSQAPASERGAACSTLQTLFAEHEDPATAPSPVLVALDPLFLAPARLELAAAAADFSSSRPSRPGDSLGTPEVFLGPAFRSQAPPVLS